MPSGDNPRYHIIIYSSWPNICIHSLEVAKVSKPAPLDLFRDINYMELFMEFLSSNNAVQVGHQTSSEPYHCQQDVQRSIVSQDPRVPITFSFIRVYNKSVLPVLWDDLFIYDLIHKLGYPSNCLSSTCFNHFNYYS